MQAISYCIEISERAFMKNKSYPGYCIVCNDYFEFTVRPVINDGWYDMRGGFICPECSQPGKIRTLAEIVGNHLPTNLRG
jgi:hypothetical protein